MPKKSTGIWQYIKHVNGPNIWYFYKRYPVEVADKLGLFDRQSLKTSDDRKAEIEAVECLRKHEFKIKAALSDTPIHDLTAVKKTDDLTPAQAAAIQTVFDVYFDEEYVFEAVDAPTAVNSLLAIYQRRKAMDQAEHIATVLNNMGVFVDANSDLFKVIVERWTNQDLQSFAKSVKIQSVAVAEGIVHDDLTKFEERVFGSNPEKKRPRATISISHCWEKYKAEVLTVSDTKRLQEEIDRHQNYVEAFINFVGDQPVNYVTRAQVNDFFNALSKRPAKLNVKERAMTFKEIIEQDLPPDRGRITKKGAIEWYSRLSRIFKFAHNLFRDQFEIQNPFEDMKGNVKGAEGTAKRDWYKNEIEALFAQKEFTDPAKRDSFFYSVLCALTHGNRLSEFHARKITELKIDEEFGFHYIDIVDAKNNHSIRKVPIAEIVIKAGFLEWVEANKKAGKEWLFPDQNHDDPDSRAFSRDFGKWLKRRKLYDPHRTLHNFRNSWLTNAYDTAYPPTITHPPLVARRVSGHSNKDVHEDYIGKNFHQMKIMVDTVRVKGLPYGRFGIV